MQGGDWGHPEAGGGWLWGAWAMVGHGMAQEGSVWGHGCMYHGRVVGLEHGCTGVCMGLLSPPGSWERGQPGSGQPRHVS